MAKKFNVTGTCIPEENYMVDITNKLEQIKKMIDAKEYFTINLLGYMDKLNEDKGYLLTFDFRESKQVQQEWTNIEGKRIFDIRI